MTEVGTPASSGWILRENNSAVGHAGWLDAFQDERAFAWRRSDSACFARALKGAISLLWVVCAFQFRSLMNQWAAKRYPVTSGEMQRPSWVCIGRERQRHSLRAPVPKPWRVAINTSFRPGVFRSSRVWIESNALSNSEIRAAARFI
jgi:hypothetical protein